MLDSQQNILYHMPIRNLLVFHDSQGIKQNCTFRLGLPVDGRGPLAISLSPQHCRTFKNSVPSVITNLSLHSEQAGNSGPSMFMPWSANLTT